VELLCFAAISCNASGSNWELALFDLGTMAKIQSMLLAAGNIDFARIATMSPDDKSLASITETTGGPGPSGWAFVFFQDTHVPEIVAVHCWST
jgi:hypothetical protein